MLSSKLPLFIGIVVLLSALLLLVVFRSLVIPLQAAFMNLLSIGASLGVVVAIFQWGWLGSVFNVKGAPDPGVHPGDAVRDRVRPVDGLRGLPRLAHPRGVDAHAATPQQAVTPGPGLDRPGDHRGGHDHDLRVPLVRRSATNACSKLFGLSLASAVFLDAFVVRSLLLPSVLQLLGRAHLGAARLAGAAPAAHRDRPRPRRRRARR